MRQAGICHPLILTQRVVLYLWTLPELFEQQPYEGDQHSGLVEEKTILSVYQFVMQLDHFLDTRQLFQTELWT